MLFRNLTINSLSVVRRIERAETSGQGLVIVNAAREVAPSPGTVEKTKTAREAVVVTVIVRRAKVGIEKGTVETVKEAGAETGNDPAQGSAVVNRNPLDEDLL
jgi:hypothetical protein